MPETSESAYNESNNYFDEKRHIHHLVLNLLRLMCEVSHGDANLEYIAGFYVGHEAASSGFDRFYWLNHVSSHRNCS